MRSRNTQQKENIEQHEELSSTEQPEAETQPQETITIEQPMIEKPQEQPETIIIDQQLDVTPEPSPTDPELEGLTAAEVKAKIKLMNEQYQAMAEKERKEKKLNPRGRGVMIAVKTAVYHNPQLMGDDLLDYLRANGVQTTIGTIVTMRSDFLNSMRVLKDLGALTAEAAAKV
jgi:FtsZ-interacting cell division protein ZipA